MPSNDPEYQKRYFADWYKRNRTKVIEDAKERRKKQSLENQRRLIEYLKAHPCVDCGETDILVLQFDHVRGKKRIEVPNAAFSGWKWESIEKEIAKCDVRCANDHIRRTLRARKSYRVRGMQVLEAA